MGQPVVPLLTQIALAYPGHHHSRLKNPYETTYCPSINPIQQRANPLPLTSASSAHPRFAPQLSVFPHPVFIVHHSSFRSSPPPSLSPPKPPPIVNLANPRWPLDVYRWPSRSRPSRQSKIAKVSPRLAILPPSNTYFAPGAAARLAAPASASALTNLNCPATSSAVNALSKNISSSTRPLKGFRSAELSG